ncbi:MAG: hypothetical protein ABI197_05185 [Granulicella sp.]
MDQATLVNPDVNAGLEALAALDAAQIRPLVALLMVSAEYDDWRLVLSSPALDQTHPLRAYEKVAATLRDHFIYTLPPILILPTKDLFIQGLRKIFAKAKDVNGMRLGGQTIGNRFISNAYVYRVQ